MMKAVAYYRVSSKEQKQEGFSIPAQQKLLLDFANKNGYKIVKEFEDDETAKQAGRSAFGRMIDYLASAKDINTILVEKTDRLYRNFRDYVTIDELEVTVILVKENERLGKDATSHQKFIHGIKVLMAKNFIDNLSEETLKGLMQKAENGYCPKSNANLGYKLTTKDGKSVYEIDEENKHIALKLFEYYATGLYSIDTLIEKMENEGYKISKNRPKGLRIQGLTKSSVQRILRSHFYYGDFMWVGKLYRGKHTPLISKELWDKVQTKLDSYKKKDSAIRHNSLNFAYKGLFTCGECGRRMTAERKIKKSGRKYVYYRCTKFHTNCSQRAISEKELDKQIVTKLEGLKLPSQDTISYVAEGLKDSLNSKRETENKLKDNLEADKKLYEHRLEKLYEDKVDGLITTEYYQKRFDEWTAKIIDLEEKISQRTQTDFDYYNFGVKILELANNANFLYKKANDEEKREVLGFILSDSQISGKKAFIDYKKPFNKIYERASCNEWGA